MQSALSAERVHSESRISPEQSPAGASADPRQCRMDPERVQTESRDVPAGKSAERSECRAGPQRDQSEYRRSPAGQVQCTVSAEWARAIPDCVQRESSGGECRALSVQNGSAASSELVQSRVQQERVQSAVRAGRFQPESRQSPEAVQQERVQSTLSAERVHSGSRHSPARASAEHSQCSTVTPRVQSESREIQQE